VDDLLDPDHTFATDGAAERGGADLSRFLDGINASRATDPHLTALGHSYGSTTTGHALQKTNGVDDAVLFGSPGASTDEVTDLHAPPGHVAVIEARDDPVADLGTFGGDTNQLDGVVGLSAHQERLPGQTDPLRESTGHSEYLTPATTSQYNIATTVADLHDRRIRGESTDAGDWVRAAF
jgi:ankyrin repeat protein